MWAFWGAVLLPTTVALSTASSNERGFLNEQRQTFKTSVLGSNPKSMA